LGDKSPLKPLALKLIAPFNNRFLVLPSDKLHEATTHELGHMIAALCLGIDTEKLTLNMVPSVGKDDASIARFIHTEDELATITSPEVIKKVLLFKAGGSVTHFHHLAEHRPANFATQVVSGASDDLKGILSLLAIAKENGWISNLGTLAYKTTAGYWASPRTLDFIPMQRINQAVKVLDLFKHREEQAKQPHGLNPFKFLQKKIANTQLPRLQEQRQQALTTLKADFDQIQQVPSFKVVDEAMNLVKQAYDDLGSANFEKMAKQAIELRFISGHLPVSTLSPDKQAKAVTHTMQDFVAKHISPELLTNWQQRTATWVAKGL
jgi:hypothetical protein